MGVDVLCVLGFLISLTYTVTSLMYYNSNKTNKTKEPVLRSTSNSWPEFICLALIISQVILRYVVPHFSRACGVIYTYRGALSLILAGVTTIVHFLVLLFWYTRQGELYKWSADNNVVFVFSYKVKLVMSLLLADFVLNGLVFSLLVMTVMRPKFKDLNPHLTATMAKKERRPLGGVNNQ